MPFQRTKILEFNKYLKSDNMPYIVYAHPESLIKRIAGCNNNPEKSHTTKIGEHILCGYVMLWAFDGIENKHGQYRGEGCTKKIFESLREFIMKIINFEKKKMIPLTKEQAQLLKL